MVLDDYVRLLSVIRASETKLGIQKYVKQLMKQKIVYRTHPTCGLKTDDTVRWWQEIGLCFLRIVLPLFLCKFLA